MKHVESKYHKAKCLKSHFENEIHKLMRLDMKNYEEICNSKIEENQII